MHSDLNLTTYWSVNSFIGYSLILLKDNTYYCIIITKCINKIAAGALTGTEKRVLFSVFTAHCENVVRVLSFLLAFLFKIWPLSVVVLIFSHSHPLS